MGTHHQPWVQIPVLAVAQAPPVAQHTAGKRGVKEELQIIHLPSIILQCELASPLYAQKYFHPTDSYAYAKAHSLSAHL